MKIAIVIFIISMSSCSLLSELRYSKMFGDSVLYEYDYGEISSHRDIGWWINNNITYAETSDIQNPEETIKKGVGDCKAKAVLYMNIAYYELGIEMSIIMVDSARTIKDGGLVDHTEVYYDGVCYSVDSGLPKKMDIGYIYSFDEVFK